MINFSTRYCNAAYQNRAKVGTATTPDVLAGKTFTNSTTVGATGTMKNNGAVTGSITTSGGSYTIPAGYHNGSGKVTGPTLAALVKNSNVTLNNASNLLSGVTAYGKDGVKYTGSMVNRGAWTNTPTTKGKVTIPAGYHNGSGYVDTTSVYNKGMQDADARVNKNSESYKQGVSDSNESKDEIRKQLLQEIYPTGVVASQSYRFDGEWTDSYQFQIQSPIECSKVEIRITGSSDENGVDLTLRSSSDAKSIYLTTNHGTFTYTATPVKSVTLDRITFPAGYSEVSFTLEVKMYY